MTQASHPFTRAELKQAFVLWMNDAEAEAAARDAVAVKDPIAVGARTVHDGVPHLPEQHAQLTDDTLILLSLLSDSLKSKVERYLSTRGQSLEGDFRTRRDALRPWVEAQLKKRSP